MSIAPLASLEALFNRLLALDPQALDRLSEMDGKVIQIEVTGTKLVIAVSLRADGIGMTLQAVAEPDAVIKGAPFALLGLVTNKGGSDSLFAGEVTISGNPHLVSDVHNIVRDLDIDWEEQIAQITGDTMARKIGVVGRGLWQWGKELRTSLAADTGDWLREEIAVVPWAREVEGFMHEVDTLRGDVDRLEQRIVRLRRERGAA